MFVLNVSFNAAADEELDYRLLVTSTGDMKWSCQLRIYQIRLRTSSFEQKHQHI